MFLRKSATLPPVILTPTRKKVPTTEPTSPSEDTGKNMINYSQIVPWKVKSFPNVIYKD